MRLKSLSIASIVMGLLSLLLRHRELAILGKQPISVCMSNIFSSEIDSARFQSTFLGATSLALEPLEIAGQQPGSLEQPAGLGSGESF